MATCVIIAGSFLEVKLGSSFGCVNILAAFYHREGFTPINLASAHIALRWSAGTLGLEFL